MEEISRKKLFISFTIIVLGFVGYWVFVSVARVGTTPRTSSVVSNTELDASLSNINATNRVSALTSSQSALNLTNEAISDISEEIISSMKTASSSSSEDLITAIQNTDVTKLDSATIQKYADAQHLGLIENVSESAFKIVETNDTSRTTYKNEYTKIVSGMSSLLSGSIQSDFTKFMQQNDSTGLDNTIKIYDNIYSALHTLEVPKSTLVFQKENILFFGNMTAILQGVRNYQSDPLRAYLLGEKLNMMPSEWDRIVSDFKTI